MTIILETTLPGLELYARGKVRDVYRDDDRLLIVATDRISAFDCVMPNGIPDKGKILTALSLFWFQKFAEQFEHHLISSDVRAYPARLQPFAEQRQDFRWPVSRVIATRGFGLPVRLLGLGTDAQVMAVQFIKAALAQTQLIPGIGQRDLLGTESG